MPINKSPQKTGRRQSLIQYAPNFLFQTVYEKNLADAGRELCMSLSCIKHFSEKNYSNASEYSELHCEKMIYCSCTKKATGNELAQMKNCTLAIQHFLLSNDSDIFLGGRKRCSICQEPLKT